VNGAKGAAYVSIFAPRMSWNSVITIKYFRLDPQIVSVASSVNSGVPILEIEIEQDKQ
jgi:hypothetical protein